MHFDNSYKIWSIKKMKAMILQHTQNPKEDMNRTFPGMYIEWWLHNLGYYITLPFTKLSKKIKWYNTRLRDVDLESHKESENNA